MFLSEGYRSGARCAWVLSLSTYLAFKEYFKYIANAYHHTIPRATPHKQVMSSLCCFEIFIIEKFVRARVYIFVPLRYLDGTARK